MLSFKKLFGSPAFVQSLIAVALLFMLSLAYFSPLMRGKVLMQYDMILLEGQRKNCDDYRARTGQEPYWSQSMFSGMPAVTISMEYKNNFINNTFGRLFYAKKPFPFPIIVLFFGMMNFFILLRLFNVLPWLAFGGAVAFGFFSYHIMIIEAGHITKVIALMMAPGVLWSLVFAYQKRMLMGVALFFLFIGMEIWAFHIQMTYYLVFLVLCYVIYELLVHLKEKRLMHFITVSVLLSVAAGGGLIANTNAWLPMSEYQQYSIRGPSELKEDVARGDVGGLDRDYAFSWSYERAELFTLLIPNVFGGSSNSTELTKDSEIAKALAKQGYDPQQVVKQGLPTYWGSQRFTSGAIYIGAITCFLFVLALLLVDSGIKYALLYATMLSFLLALGEFSFSLIGSIIALILPLVYYFTQQKITNGAWRAQFLYGLGLVVAGVAIGSILDGYRFTDLFFDYLPLYNKFRVPSSILTVAALSMPWLAIIGAQRIFDDTVSNERKGFALYAAGGITGGFALLCALLPEAFFSFEGPQDAEIAKSIPIPGFLQLLRADRAGMLSKDGWRSFFFIALAALILWLYVRGTIKQTNVVSIVLAVLMLADIWFVDRRYLANDGFVEKSRIETQVQPRPADVFLLQNDKSYFRVLPMSRNPFNDGKTPYYLNTIGGYSAAKIKRYQQLIEKHISNLTPTVLNMLNCKYVIFDKEYSLPPSMQKLKVFEDKEVLYQNLAVYGPAWICQKALIVPDADAAIDTLDGLDLRTVAVIEQKDADKCKGFSTDSVDYTTETIKLIQNDNRVMKYEYNSTKARMVNFSEVYYPKGWQATIDGQPAEILHTNFVLRGLVVPAGKHIIEFKFEPEIIYTTERLNLIGGILLLVSLLGVVFFEYRQLAKNSDKQSNKT